MLETIGLGLNGIQHIDGTGTMLPVSTTELVSN